MPLSTSRQQFLAYESHPEQDIHYKRKGGVFISTCICIIFIIFAILIAILVGIIVYYITFFKISQKSEDFWDETDPFGQSHSPSPDLRLPSNVIPSFYRLKIRADLEKANFSGDVYITIKAKRKVNQVILHSKDLIIGNELTLTEQIYEKLDTLQSSKTKREVITENSILRESNTTLPNATTEETTTVFDNSTYMETDNATSIITTTPVSTQVTHSNVRNINITSVKYSSGDRLVLNLGSYLTPNVDYTLQMSFKGNISKSLTGFYQSTYTENNELRQVAVTQFEPTSARAAFPCFDEPEFKAKFEISIAHKQNVTVLSNMKIAIEEPMESDAEWKWTHFERSVNMSTYLVAYVLSDFVNVETSYVSKGNITKPIRIWTRPSLISKANYALTIVPKLLSFYEDLFGVAYALDKMDLIAIPDFSSGAMENWGLITFRETTLLYDDVEGIPREKQNVAIDISHELAHQWFGDLVTMKWWTDLWLNEGFATYIEYVGVNHIAPEWDMFETFTRDKMNLLRTDALKNTAPVSQKVIDASEIAQKFDEISYAKGANLIRMLNHTISQELFHKGLVIYLNLWKYQNAEEQDLWQAMSLATKESSHLKGLSVVEFMNSWTKQPGYPVVTVVRNYDNGYVTFEQKLFTSNKNDKKLSQKWQIPISYSTNSSNWGTEAKFFLKDNAITTEIDVNSSQPLYVNVEAIGYYRVNYDHKNWNLLNKALKNGELKSPIAKAQLIDDAFNLAKTNHLDYSYALGLTTCVIDGEEAKIVWDLLLNNMAFLSHNLKATSGYMYFQDYMKIILKKQLERLNYGLDKPKDDNEAFLIENLVLWECLVESPRCLKWTKDQFETWISKPNMTDNPIPSFLRSLVYNMAVKNGGRREFEILWNMFLNTSDPNIKNLIISNLPSTKEESLITLLLERSLSEIPTQYAILAWSMDGPVGTKMAQDFLINNFDKVYKRFNDMDSFMFAGVLNGAFGFITTNDELTRFKQFALAHKSELQSVSHTLQKIADSGAVRINWINTHAKNINTWFKTYVEEHAANSTIQQNSTDNNVTSSSLNL